MSTFERQIDALGGTHNEDGEYNADYADGHKRALEEARQIAVDADAVVEELLETLADVLLGGRPLQRWAEDAQTMVARVYQRRAA